MIKKINKEMKIFSQNQKKNKRKKPNQLNV